MEEKVILVKDYLNQVKTRCTYNAAAEAIGITVQALKKELGKPHPEASWFVSAAKSEPLGYKEEDKHPELYRITRIITSAKVLKRNLGI